jgi:TRAP transporter TAXI family solute receptor
MGIDVDNDITAHRTGFGDASSLLQDGHIDVIFAVLGVPASAIVELEVTTELNFLEITEDLYRQMVEAHPYFERVAIPAGTYSNTEDVYILSCQAVLYACYTLDEDLVYHLTRVFFNYASETAVAHAMGRYILLETAIEGITTPFHLGAVRFLESVGISIPSDLIVD